MDTNNNALQCCQIIYKPGVCCLTIDSTLNYISTLYVTPMKAFSLHFVLKSGSLMEHLKLKRMHWSSPSIFTLKPDIRSTCEIEMDVPNVQR